MVVPGQGVARPDQAALTRPRVLVVDAQPLFVVVLSHLLSGPGLGAETLSAATTDSALDMLRGEQIGVLLCDVRVGPLPFRDFLSAVGRTPGAPPVVLLADVQDEALLLAAIETGAAGFFTKDADPTQFLDGVRSVLQGHRALGSSVMRMIVARLNGGDSSARPALARLSPTEIDILAMVAAARSIPSIASARGISQKTVRNHLANIYRKLELRSRTEAMLYAARMGLTPD
jgi:DNA-binding NarL/FixJ family response regulator